ncbi:hypothetical protein Pcinc_008298 [Petrolisthes cinctipes]|uniref:Uncharacterized protein n=1 Tax=Petrolisthes cinctipes TaxID=88211 RepID=A0AAE1G6V5_PETCI|nr:hypothetical protein Pcinc_008298 [Petrolisthes cinctipes]
MRNPTTPLSKPRVAPGPLSNLRNSTTQPAWTTLQPHITTNHHHSTLHSTPLRHQRRRQRYATTPLSNHTRHLQQRYFYTNIVHYSLPVLFLYATSPVFSPPRIT